MRQSVLESKKIALIGVPSSAGARRVGQEQAPRSLRRSGLVESLRAQGHDVADLGDLKEVSFSPDRQNQREQNIGLVLSILEEVARRVDLAVANRAWPLVVGGDCTVTIGVLAALTKHFAELGMIYLDGDVDLNTPETTTSGIFDGMVLAHILGRGVHKLSHVGSRCPLLGEKNITLFGYSERAGGIDPVELEFLKRTQMTKYPLERIKDRVRNEAARALRELASKAEHILVHFDVDVVDRDEFPAVDVPHKPGLSLRGLVLTEFNAACGADGKLAVRLNETIQEAMAARQLVDQMEGLG